jgi:hypothetical protein
MDDAVDIEIIGEKDKLEEKYLPDTVSLKFKNPYLRKFMADWALMKEYLNNADDDIKKIKNPDVQESVRMILIINIKNLKLCIQPISTIMSL